MELINRMRKNRKGFTLVEIIVVLVILAILAAFTIPTMLGFVEDAKGKALIAEAREVYVAAQATATEFGATTELIDADLSTALSSEAVSGQTAQGATDAAKASYQMNKYLSNDLTISTAVITAAQAPAKSAAWAVTVQDNANPVVDLSSGKVKSLIFVKNGYQVTIEGGNATVAKWKATT